MEEIRARVAAAPPMSYRREFAMNDAEREAWTVDEDDDSDWPDWMDAEQGNAA
jgi:hypothetical protein